MLHCSVLHLHCSFVVFMMSPYIVFFPPTFNNYTGGQSVSSVLLWQPSDCIDMFVIDYISLLFLENIYDDDDDDDAAVVDSQFRVDVDILLLKCYCYIC